MQAQWQALAVLTLARVSLGFQVQSIASVSPELVADLGLSYADLGTLLGLYYLPGLVLAFPGGALGRRFGDKRVVIYGLCLMVLGGAVTAWSWNFASLVAGRFLSGVGAIVLNVLMSKMVTDWFAGRREIVLGMAVLVNSLPIGMGIAMLVLGPLSAIAGWSAALASTAAASFAALLLVFLAYAEHPNDRGAADVAGHISAREVLLMCLAGAIWGVFNGSVAVMTGFAPTFLAGEGHTATGIALLVGVTIWLSAASVQAGGMLAQRWDGHAVLMAIGALGWAACLALLASGAGLSAAALIGSGLVLGLPVGVILALPAGVLRPESRSVGLGLFYTCLYAGNTLLPPVAGWVQDLTGSATASLGLTAVLVAGMFPLYGLFHAVARHRTPG